ncbi:LANC-LIKE PROTEIN [Salix koriyanagi]|uniref:LANC-LIKE PROTEIN n=1 Tax=Salix koriyanagi TaxID=2511006 RepID=A0A9Q1AMF3_9ROSI|nr:LANC-LIKE PROTEIN [Salix koriyanagi]
MGDRYFPNEMPDYIPETATAAVDETITERNNEDSLTKLLSLPYNILSQRLKASALELKDTVVRETWGMSGKRVKDYSLYTGALGTAYLLFKAYQVTKNQNDLNLCSDIIKACDSVSRDSGRVTFICGRAGVCALGAVAAKHAGDGRLLDHYLAQFKERAVVDEIIKAGRLTRKEKCPLLYEWHGKRYWGAAHGMSGIMLVLMDLELTPDEVEDVKVAIILQVKEMNRIVLCIGVMGAPGIALTLAKAAEVFGDKEFLQAAIEAGEVVWNRGNGEYLYRAKAFACFLHDRAQELVSEGKMHGGDRPYSLFEGFGGMAHLFLDILEPSEARFPAYEL